MKITRSPAAISRLVASWHRRGLRVGFVPTMGALHQAHLSLMHRACRENDRVVVSIFVNPLQFGPKEDLSRYPRPFRRDAQLCRLAGVDALYNPGPAVMYSPGFGTSVSVDGLSELYCGASRPGHFRGVATVVLKLLNQVNPERLYLGEKDFQQLAIIRRMLADLDMRVRVIACRLMRCPDGLALSSRNAYLSPAERAVAPQLHAALRTAAAAARARGATPASVLRAGRTAIARTKAFRLDYMALVEGGSLAPARRLGPRQRLLAAIWLGNTRLIDNMPLGV